MKLKDSQRKVASERLHKLVAKGMMPAVADDFDDNEHLVYYSERTPLGGILYWANDLGDCPQEVQDKIKELEDKYNSIVYHITHEYTDFGECYDFWLVEEEDITYYTDQEELFERGYTFSYVMNMTEPSFSEFGTIGYKLVGGGAIRVS